MADVKDKLLHLFHELVKDKKNSCRLQFDVLKEYREVKESGGLDAWAEELPNRFPKEFASYNKTTVPMKTTATVPMKTTATVPMKTTAKISGNIVLRETLSNGDCFFSSIFRAGVEQGFVNKIKECLKLKATNEKEFIQAFRNMLATRVRYDRLPKSTNPDGSTEDTYDVLKATFKMEIPGMVEQPGKTGKGILSEKQLRNSTYTQVLSAFPAWFEDKFKKGIPDDKKDFLEKVAQGISTMRNWVGTIEVEMAKHILNSACKITLKTYSSELTNAEPVDEKGQPTIHLRNLGEGHWEYYSFDLKKSIVFPLNASYPIAPAKGGKRITRKKSKRRV
jgi:hypothetical protein